MRAATLVLVSVTICTALRKDYMAIMSGNEMVSVTFKYYQEYDGLLVPVCDGESCSRLEISGVAPNGELRYKALAWCDHGNPNCDIHHTNDPDGAVPFPSGEMTVVVRLDLTELTVNLLGHEDKTAKVPVKSTNPRQRMWVKPSREQYPLVRDMPLQIIPGTPVRAQGSLWR